MKKEHTKIMGIVARASLLLAVLLFMGRGSGETAVSAATDFGYGFNVAEWDVAKLQGMGFNWIKVFDPPGGQLPVKVLYRHSANASHLGNVSGFAKAIGAIAQNNGAYIDAYEIGNEPNLDASYGWAQPPNAADYATLLCAAYAKIKAADPTAVVVSAGLAPTGRVQGNWNGHPGHNGLFQDEREYFKEFVAAGGGSCLDAVGYHPYGYSADYNAAPDSGDADPTKNCANGFCFRGAEKLYELMQANGLGGKKMWATEFGWIVDPPANCLTDPGWQGRAWQIVSEQKQASNLVGAYQYATANWPWMGAMFVFNLNFNVAPWISNQCEQMRFYSVVNRPAEAALRDMPKQAPVGELTVTPGALARVILTSDQPYSETAVLHLQNTGSLGVSYTATAVSGSALKVSVAGNGSGTLAPGASQTVQLGLSSAVQPVGQYAASVNVAFTYQGGSNSETVPLTLFVFDQIYPLYLPVVQRP